MFVILLLLYSGCMPVPLTGHTRYHKNVSEDEVKFIEIGRTTREDVVLHLGAPSWSDKDTFKYFSEKYGGAVAFFVPYIATGTFVRKLVRVFLIEFDPDSTVKKYYFTEVQDTTFVCNVVGECEPL